MDTCSDTVLHFCLFSMKILFIYEPKNANQTKQLNMVIT